jgi:hypothetical protein
VDAKALEGFDWPTVLDAAEDGVEGLPERLREIAEEIAASDTGRRILDKPDRSERDFALAAHFFHRGMEVTEAGQVAFALSPEKLLEKEQGGLGEDYASRTLARAKARVQTLRPEDFFDPVTFPVSVPEKRRERGFTLKKLRDVEIREPEFLVRGLVETDSVAVVFGDPGGGKSFLALDLVACVASGRAFHGRPVRSGPVVYIAGEGHNGIRRRLSAWEKQTGTDLDDAPFFLSLSAARLVETSPSKQSHGHCKRPRSKMARRR